jgi:uridine kinase
LVSRDTLLKGVAEIIMHIELSHPTRVAIDGSDSAGKTIFANGLKPLIEEHGREVIRASVDGFHNPRAERYQRGRLSPEGYYIDSYNYRALLDSLLLPLGPGGNLEYRDAVFDYQEDRATDRPTKKASPDAVLLFDGIFLLRPELVGLWDLRIYLDISYDEMMLRGVKRDGGDAETKELYTNRYMPGQKLYQLHSSPKRKADIVIDNRDPLNPRATHINPNL